MSVKLHIQIESGTINDAEVVYGLYLISSDNTIVAPVKEYETQEYPESAAVEIYPYTTKEPFDYTCKMLIMGDKDTVNESITAFYDSLFEVTEGVDLRKAKKITIYNEEKGIQVSGYAKTMTGNDYHTLLTEYEKEAFLFDFVLYIADPRTLIPWHNE